MPTPHLLEPAGSGNKAADNGLSHKADGLSHKADGLSHVPAATAHKLAGELRAALPRPLQSMLEHLGRRSPPAEVMKAIEAVCRHRELTGDELSALIGRRGETVRRYVARLVRDGRLVQTYPQQPKHPQQAYRAAVGDPKCSE